MPLSPENHAHWQGERTLACIARREETADTATFTLAHPDGTGFSFLPGQFISVAVRADQRAHWRAYSISSSPAKPESVSITVRRVPGGKVSNQLLDALQPGMEIQALAPAGDFALAPNDIPAEVVLLSSGCGITPMRSITLWLLENHPDTTVHFIHSARDENHFIYRDEVLALAERHPRLKLHCFLSQPQGRLPCQRGRLDAARLKALLPAPTNARAYLCGQKTYRAEVSGWLREAGFAEDTIIQEDFTPLQSDTAAGAARFRLDVPGFGKHAEIGDGELLLDVLEREGLPIIGACRTGVCGACKCTLIDGEIERGSTMPLSPEEQAAGLVLACSSRARSDLTIALG